MDGKLREKFVGDSTVDYTSYLAAGFWRGVKPAISNEHSAFSHEAFRGGVRPHGPAAHHQGCQNPRG